MSFKAASTIEMHCMRYSFSRMLVCSCSNLLLEGRGYRVLLQNYVSVHSFAVRSEQMVCSERVQVMVYSEYMQFFALKVLQMTPSQVCSAVRAYHFLHTRYRSWMSSERNVQSIPAENTNESSVLANFAYFWCSCDIELDRIKLICFKHIDLNLEYWLGSTAVPDITHG